MSGSIHHVFKEISLKNLYNEPCCLHPLNYGRGGVRNVKVSPAKTFALLLLKCVCSCVIACWCMSASLISCLLSACVISTGRQTEAVCVRAHVCERAISLGKSADASVVTVSSGRLMLVCVCQCSPQKMC